MFTGKTPDFTPPAWVALVVTVLTNLEIVFNLNLSAKRESALEGIINGAFILGFLAHDAYVRRGRSNVAAAQAMAVSVADNSTPMAAAEPTSTV